MASTNSNESNSPTTELTVVILSTDDYEDTQSEMETTESETESLPSPVCEKNFLNDDLEQQKFHESHEELQNFNEKEDESLPSKAGKNIFSYKSKSIDNVKMHNNDTKTLKPSDNSEGQNESENFDKNKSEAEKLSHLVNKLNDEQKISKNYEVMQIKAESFDNRSGSEPFPTPVLKNFSQKSKLIEDKETEGEKPSDIEKPFACMFCDKSYKQRYTLKRHLRVHTGEKPYTCDICGEAFFERRHRMDHMHIKHTNIKPYICIVCGKDFATESQIKRHKIIHKDKPFACSHCEKKFRSKKLLDAHALIHTVGKPFPCPICHKRFGKKHYLKTHISSLHYGEKPFRCEDCGRCFSQESNMRVHAEIHIIERAYGVSPSG